jgi:DNA-binding transcriptional LysR family regulator
VAWERCRRPSKPILLSAIRLSESAKVASIEASLKNLQVDGLSRRSDERTRNSLEPDANSDTRAVSISSRHSRCYQARLLDGGLRQCNNCRVHLVNLETFVCMAELGGLTPAARSLGIPKSTVARRVERLEAELGVALVQRTGRGLALTDDGRALVERCAASLREIQAVEDTLTDSSARPTGKLSVALPLDGSVSAGLISLVTTFSSDFSAVRVRLQSINPRQTGIEKLEDGSDVVLQFSLSGADEPMTGGVDYVISRRLGTVPMGLVASSQYADAHGVPDSLDDLHRHRCLTISEGPMSAAWLLRDASNHVHEVPIAPAIHVDDPTALLALVMAGAGISIMPYHISQAYIEQGLMQPILQQWSPPPLVLHLQWLRSRHLAPRVRAFVDHVQARLCDLRWLATS